MSLILRILFMALTTTGIYLIAGYTLYLPGKTALGVIRHPHGKPSTEEQFAQTRRPVTALLSALFPMSEYRRARYETDFARLGMTITPQDYVSGKIARSLMLALLGLAFIPLEIPWLTVLTGITGILACFQSDQKLRREIEKLNQAINAELPRMVGTMECTLGDSRDLRPRRWKGYGTGAGRAPDRPPDRQSGNGPAPHGGARAVQQPFRAHHDPAGRGSGR